VRCHKRGNGDERETFEALIMARAALVLIARLSIRSFGMALQKQCPSTWKIGRLFSLCRRRRRRNDRARDFNQFPPRTQNSRSTNDVQSRVNVQREFSNKSLRLIAAELLLRSAVKIFASMPRTYVRAQTRIHMHMETYRGIRTYTHMLRYIDTHVYTRRVCVAVKCRECL